MERNLYLANQSIKTAIKHWTNQAYSDAFTATRRAMENLCRAIVKRNNLYDLNNDQEFLRNMYGNESSILNRIDYLRRQNVITQDECDFFHQIRKDGNMAAHEGYAPQPEEYQRILQLQDIIDGYTKKWEREDNIAKMKENAPEKEEGEEKATTASTAYVVPQPELCYDENGKLSGIKNRYDMHLDKTLDQILKELECIYGTSKEALEERWKILNMRLARLNHSINGLIEFEPFVRQTYDEKVNPERQELVNKMWREAKAREEAENNETIVLDEDNEEEKTEQPIVSEPAKEGEPTKKTSPDFSNGKVVLICIVVFVLILMLCCHGGNANSTTEGTHATIATASEEKDIFADLTVEFDGTNGEGVLSYDYAGDEDGITFSDEGQAGLSNGDEVTINVNIENEETFAKKYGYLPESYSKTYTVEGLWEYADSYEEIPETAKEEAKSEASKLLSSKIAEINTKGYGESFDGLEYVGDYSLFAKISNSNASYKNYYGMVFKTNYSNAYNSSICGTKYLFVCYSNVKINDQGEYSIDFADEMARSFTNISKYFVDTNELYTSVNDIKTALFDTKQSTYNGSWNISSDAYQS